MEGSPGKTRPADIAFNGPRPPLKSFTIECWKQKTPRGAICQSEGCRRFSGANSIASALGIRLGATPYEREDYNTHL